MRTLFLKRMAQSAAGTFGVLVEDEVPFAVTLELPWMLNRTDISCIPCGNYRCIRVTRLDGTPTFEVTEVKDRTAILFHIANTLKDLKGCIGVAEEFGVIGDEPAIQSSGRGFQEFMDKLKDEYEFDLVISGGRGEMHSAIIDSAMAIRVQTWPIAGGIKEIPWDEKLKWWVIRAYDAVQRAKAQIDARESRTKRTLKRVLTLVEAVIRIGAYFSGKGLLNKLL